MSAAAPARSRFADAAASPITQTLIVFVVALAAYMLSTGFGHATYDNFIRLAYALLHGRLWLDWDPTVEAVFFNGQHYAVEGFMPAVVAIPAVLIFGLDANQAVICAIAAAIGVCAAWVMLGHMRVSRDVQIAVTAFFAFGTVYWWCAAFGSLWQYAHVVGVMFAMIALAEWYGARRPWLLGVLFACMAFSRFPMALAGIPFLVWLVLDTPKAARARALLQCIAGVAPFVLLYLLYNYGRWNTFADIGYSMWFHADAAGAQSGSPFQLRFLPGNLYSYLLLPAPLSMEFPWLRPTPMGVALTFTSPALALAFLAPVRNRETPFLWVAALLVAIPSLLYYVNGYEQFGMRHSLDFTPFLLPLVARGLERLKTFFTFALIGFSILANAYGIWYSWTYHAYGVVPR
jgi:hypothetical protein